MTAIEILVPFRPAVAREPVALVRAWLRRRRERTELRRLLADPRLLADTGLDRAAVAAEAAKPFWAA